MNDLASDLRALADLIDANPDLSIDFAGGETSLYLDAPGLSFPDTVRRMVKLGKVDKGRGVDLFKASIQFSDRFKITALDHGNEVACERVQTGTEVVTRPVMAQVGEETVEVPTFAWVCPESILAAS